MFFLRKDFPLFYSSSILPFYFPPNCPFPVKMKKSSFSIDNLITSNLTSLDQRLTIQTGSESQPESLTPEKSLSSENPIFTTSSKVPKISASPVPFSMRNMEKKEKLFLQKFITDQQQNITNSGSTANNSVQQFEEKESSREINSLAHKISSKNQQIPSLLFQNSFSVADPVCPPVSLAHFGSLAAAASMNQFYPGVNETVAGLQFPPSDVIANSSPVSSGYSPVNSLDLMTQRSLITTAAPGEKTLAQW